jgi:hypothetical protein
MAVETVGPLDSLEPRKVVRMAANWADESVDLLVVERAEG